MVRRVQFDDATQIAEIYNYYILNSVATFEEKCIGEEEIKKRIGSGSGQLPWLVYEQEGKVIGYAYASEWNSRSAYKQTVESSVYLHNERFGKGIGSKLYKELLKQLKDLKFHAIIGGISLPNSLSIALHEKFGFEKIAHFKEVGFKFKKWIDVGYWELLIGDKTKDNQ